MELSLARSIGNRIAAIGLSGAGSCQRPLSAQATRTVSSMLRQHHRSRSLAASPLRPSHAIHHQNISFAKVPCQRHPTGRASLSRLSCRSQSDESTGENLASSLGTRTDADWLALLPEATSALYCCSLPGIEAWLRSLGFQQLPVRPEEWRIEKDTWQAELSLDVTELNVRYTSQEKAGGGSKSTVERRFSYALSRQDLENAILSGP